MSEEAIKGLNTFVFYFAIPALLFRATAGGLELVELSIIAAYFSAVLATFLVALGVARAVFRTGPAERALFGMGSVFSNTVLLAIPLIFTALRSEEHTSELQSLMRISYAVFCLKKKKKKN